MLCSDLIVFYAWLTWACFFQVVYNCTVAACTLLKIHFKPNEAHVRMLPLWYNLVDWTTHSLIGFSCSQRNQIDACYFFFCQFLWRPVFSFSRWFILWVQARCSLSKCTKVCAKIFIASGFYLDSSSFFFTQIGRVRHALDSGKKKS